ncbi:restriction endonuclease [Amycolatopsis magusensis]|uniref:restriction endonuclease n=1 Tax=Amycolatopsis magusensis TaxID=882444 RepID=UPI0024A94DF7|nr:restriction endonuclease [Amycolatopsis magusensis]MDI5977981.1 restriction endonuclease [Amycolatopsis magusensis]
MGKGQADKSKHGNPWWQRYEISIHEMLSAFDPAAFVRHNTQIPGRFSQVPRQIDVWATGTVIGQQISVAVECKMQKRPVDVQIIDAFIGKLLDIGADRGVIYSYSGFSNGANMRAYAARSPAVLTVALKTPRIVKDSFGVPGYPADLLVQDVPPHWIEDLDKENFRIFIKSGQTPKFL